MKSLAILLLVAVSSMAFAGKEGHGGNAVVCRNSTGKIKSAELLDLFEGRVSYKLNIIRNNTPFEQQLQDVVKKIWKINDEMGAFLSPLIDNVKVNKTVLQDDVTLAPVDDAFPPVIPSSCKIEQLANYINDEEILVNGSIWKKLGPTDQAALLVHEGLYRFLRRFGEKDSRRTRKIVAYLFSDFPLVPVNEGLPKNATLCQSIYNEHYYKFYYYRVQDDIIGQFTWIDGKPLFSKKTAMVSYVAPIGRAGSVTETNFEKNDGIDTVFFSDKQGEISGDSGVEPGKTYTRTAFQCHPASSKESTAPYSEMSMVAVPEAPILIDSSSTLEPQAPYFSVPQLQILWAGIGTARLEAITITSMDPNVGLPCIYKGDDLKKLFPQLVQPSGEILFEEGTPAQPSTYTYCHLIVKKSANPFATYDIPAEIAAYATVIGPQGDGHIVKASTIVRIQ